MARNNDKQHMFWQNGWGFDCGYIAFTTTSGTVEISTSLSKIYSATFTLVAAAAGTDPISGHEEHLWMDETPNSGDGSIDVSGGAITLARAATPILLQSEGEAEYVTANDYVELPIGVCPVAGTLNAAWVYNDVIPTTGTIYMNIGKVETGGAGAIDIDYFLANAQANVPPASSTGEKITTFAATDVAAEDLLTYSTNDATGAAGEGCFVQVQITPTLASGLAVFYELKGID